MYLFNLNFTFFRFHGKMDRFKASIHLKNDGDFLVRLGKSMDDLSYKPVLSVKWGNQHHHFIIKELNSVFWIEKLQFPSIASLIRFHLHSKKPIKEHNGVILKTPILSKKFMHRPSSHHPPTNSATLFTAARGHPSTHGDHKMKTSKHRRNQPSSMDEFMEVSRSISVALLGEDATPYVMDNIGTIVLVCLAIVVLYLCTVL